MIISRVTLDKAYSTMDTHCLKQLFEQATRMLTPAQFSIISRDVLPDSHSSHLKYVAAQAMQQELYRRART